MHPDAIARVAELERLMLAQPQTEIETLHVLHAGMYARTIAIPAGTALTGALVKVPTMLVVAGNVLVSRGDEEALHIVGASVVPAAAGRKTAFLAYEDTVVTMLFPTDANTVAAAEEEFTDDHERLMSRADPERNTIIITGE
ncbi:MAG: hypothetical protein INH12_07020 [Cupriavidus sp.]|nr:hypothetical protein [Cupriavidus sp.]QWE96004.1 hypothetical protein KLP38_09605 [Cupriavidus sp. EM10]MCA3189818.1 hypothetical protein [Cupriavidus sp.]MCA3196412.1 hypothetical protein [Cupriavidus sp.]MCA3202157.1 hypothetical protein [Cupriavidus sp.]